MRKRQEAADRHLTDKIREYFPEDDAVLFDIETTGLSWKSSHVYLIGVLYCSGGEWRMAQWFLDRPSEEKNLLQMFGDFLFGLQKGRSGNSEGGEDYSENARDAEDAGNSGGVRLLHFNGNLFDLPYIRHKCEFYGLPDPFEEMKSVDIYREVRPFQKLLGLPSMKQKDVEQFLGIEREDRYSGGDLIPVYRRYLESRDEALLNLLFLHNHDDVAGMADILPALSYPLFFGGGFRLSGEAEMISGENSPERQMMRLHAEADHAFPVPASMTGKEEGAALQLGCGGDPRGADLLVDARKTEMKHFFADYRNYFYLPDEDRAIHRDVAIFVDPEHREKARAATCYQKACGTFLPQLSGQIEPVFYTDYKAKPAYFRWEDLQQKLDGSEGTEDAVLHQYLLDYLGAFRRSAR
ncbi:MAG: ribonuclease H-like domain-containing protein [Bilifractor sp.]|jgi:uncharacterized protein YprB with RNaseH-like and TPR domain